MFNKEDFRIFIPSIAVLQMLPILIYMYIKLKEGGSRFTTMIEGPKEYGVLNQVMILN